MLVYSFIILYRECLTETCASPMHLEKRKNEGCIKEKKEARSIHLYIEMTYRWLWNGYTKIHQCKTYNGEERACKN